MYAIRSYYAERVILGLSEVPGLTVQSFQAVEEYVGGGLGAMEIGKEMNVDAVLTFAAGAGLGYFLELWGTTSYNFV